MASLPYSNDFFQTRQISSLLDVFSNVASWDKSSLIFLKGAALFAKRKKKSEEWVVDEQKVKALMREQEEKKFNAPPLNTSSPYPTIGRQVKTQVFSIIKTNFLLEQWNTSIKSHIHTQAWIPIHKKCIFF